MQGRDRRLDLVGAGAPVTHGLVDQGEALGDHRLVPEAAILVFHQHDLALGVDPRGRAGVLQQHQGGQAHDLRLGLEEPQQQASQADRLVAQRPARPGLLGVGRIALVEHQVDHRRHGREAF